MNKMCIEFYEHEFTGPINHHHHQFYFRQQGPYKIERKDRQREHTERHEYIATQKNVGNQSIKHNQIHWSCN